MKKVCLVLSVIVIIIQSNMYTQSNTPTDLGNQFLIDTKIPKTAEVLPMFQHKFGIPIGVFPNPIGISMFYNYTKEQYRIKNFKAESASGGSLANILKPGMNEWKISNGLMDIQSHIVGAQIDVTLFPFLQLFGLVGYISMDQSIYLGEKIGVPTIFGPIDIPTSLIAENGTLQNKLEGWVAVAGANFVVAYKGFFAALMISGGYVCMNDKVNNIRGFVKKPLMYVAPRIGYQYKSIFRLYTGVQYIELFGSTEGSDLSKVTDGLLKSFSIEFEKFPVNFLAGIQFFITREFSLGMEYAGGPNMNGVNVQISGRF
ncbi:MAG: hypothetical protein ACRCS8_01160 [Brevinema sp.]